MTILFHRVLIQNILAIILVLASRTLLLMPISLQQAISFSVSDPIVEFGSTIHFTASVQPKDALNEVILFIQPQGADTLAQKISVDNGKIDYQFNVQQNPIRPFAQTTYWFEGVTNGDRVASDKYTFDYIDNRFKWQSKEDQNFQVNWYEGDVIFGQTALDIANNSVKSAQNYLEVPGLLGKVRIFIYPDAVNLQKALQLSQKDWVAGNTSADLRTILISVSSGPEQRLELERQIPHEITHILEYDLVNNAYTKIPAWLIEGTASLSEIYPNSDYPRVLDKAAKNGTVKPIIELCSGFPQEASGAFLSYAESASFTRYLYQKYGYTKMNELYKAHQDGLGCEEGPLKVLGISLSQLDTRWRQEVLGMNPGAIATRNLLPFAVILLLVIIPPLFSGIYALRK